MGCPTPGVNNCAHYASQKLYEMGYGTMNDGPGEEFRFVDGMCRCSCGLVLRAKELRDWASIHGQYVSDLSDSGLYVIYEEAPKYFIKTQGHVYLRNNGEDIGGSWSGAKSKQYYKLQ